jgi:ABC-type uncharacterized transport system permease subunit
VPIILGAIAGILCERSGIINIAIEGQLLGSAFAGAVVGSLFGPWVGILGALAMGVGLSAILAVFSSLRVDPMLFYLVGAMICVFLCLTIIIDIWLLKE